LRSQEKAAFVITRQQKPRQADQHLPLSCLFFIGKGKSFRPGW
jgi:hypothetical protein